MIKSKKLLIAIILSALIISCSGCEIDNTKSEISQSSEISVESSESSSSEEIKPEPEPVLKTEFTLLSNKASRGGYFTIKAENCDFSNFVFTDMFGNERGFFEINGAWYCFIPIKADTDAGYYPLKISSKDFEFSTTVTVEDKKLKKQYLVVEQKTLEATLEDAAVREEFAVFSEEKAKHFTKKPLWNKEFVHPLGDRYYKETTSYGTFRTFSNGKTEWHDAIDMAVGGGTPIYATNSGNVLFAGFLGLSGNTIIIDHGCGILSWHYHLHKIEVAEGDFVEKNTEIGKVGTTGLSTGNHLHFGITVGGIFVDPMEILYTEPEFDF